MSRSHSRGHGLARASTAATLFLIVACGGGSGDSRAGGVEGAETASATIAAGPANACVALPAAAVREVLGVPVRDSLALSMRGGGTALQMSQCNYATVESPAAVSLMLRRRAEGETTERLSEGVRQTLTESGIASESVSGVGDLAFFASNQLHVFVGERWYLIVTPVPSGGLEQARALAQRAIGNL